MGRRAKYNGYGGQNTMGMGVKTPWVGGSIYHGLGGQHSMGRMVKMQWIGVQYNMGRGSNYHG